MWENVRPFQWKKTVCIQPDICGGYIRFYKTALFHKKPPHGGNHVLHVQHGGASRISGFPASFPAFRPWKKRPGIGAGFRSRLAFLPDFKLVLRLHFPENRSFLPPGPAQFPFRLRVKASAAARHSSCRHPGRKARPVRGSPIRPPPGRPFPLWGGLQP